MFLSRFDGVTAARQRALDHAANAVDMSVGLLVRWRIFLLSIMLTTIYAFPSLIDRSRNVAYLYTGDVRGFYWPLMAKIHDRMARLHFISLDFSVFNGSSEFFLSPNTFEVHPLYILFSLATRHSKFSMTDYGHILVWLVTIHMFIFFYFSWKLLSRFLDLSLSMAGFGAAFCAFGVGTVGALGEPEFLFTVSALPWTIYAALDFEARGTALKLPLAAIPTLLLVLGGYIPVGVACLFLATAFIAAHVLYLRAPLPGTRDRLEALIRSALPIACGLVVVAPYLVAVNAFYKQSPAIATPSLFYAAHEFSEIPSTVLRILTPAAAVPGPLFEFTLQWGFVPLAITLLFIGNASISTGLRPEHWRTLKLCGAIYAATALSIYGIYSPLSDMIYYFIPQVGKMHVYQRFLYPAALLLGIALAIMLDAASRVKETRPLRIAALVSIALTLSSAYALSFHRDRAVEIGLGSAILIELMLLSIFLSAMTVPGHAFKALTALAVVCIPTLNLMYGWSRDASTYITQKNTQPLLVDPEYRKQVVDFVHGHYRKDIVKYQDLTALWTRIGIDPSPKLETFPKSFSYLVLGDVDLSSYSGFNFYLAPTADYMRRVPITGQLTQAADWTWLKATHADFVVAKAEDIGKLRLAGYIDERPDSSMVLPYGMTLASLNFARHSGEPVPVFDNGYFHVSPAKAERLSDRREVDLALNRPARQSGVLGDAGPELAVDGNVDGNFANGSVSHTPPDRNAWWEVDLGERRKIDRVTLWNRTDCCTPRLSDAWVFISDTPFDGSDTAAVLRKRPGTWARYVLNVASKLNIETGGLEGRYVRVQFDGSDRGQDAYLSLAEVQVFAQPESPPAAAPSASGGDRVTDFWTNNADRLHLHVKAVQPLDVAYQFWSVPGLSYALDGRTIEPRDVDGLKVVRVEPGEHDIDIRFVDRPLTVFWVFFFLFWLCCAAAVAVRVWIASKVAIVAFRAAFPTRS